MAEHRDRAIIRLFWIFGIFGAWHQARAEDIKLKALNSSLVMASRGSNLTLSCEANQVLNFLLTHTLDWRREPRIPMPDTGLPHVAAFHSATHNKEGGNGLLITTLHLHQVTDEDDGRYICQAKRLQSPSVLASASIDVIVRNAAERVTLKVDGMVRDASSKVTTGSHSVLCLAEAVNLDHEELRMELGNERLPTSSNATKSLMPEASASARAPRYRLQAETRMLVDHTDDGKILTCAAVSSVKVNSTALRVVPVPSVNCEDVKVHRDHRHVELKCEVTHVNVTVSDYLWELTHSGINHSSADRSDGVTQEPTDRQTKVSLALTVQQWGDPRTLFRLTAVTEVGNFSGEAYVIVVPDNEGTDGDDENNNDNNGDVNGAVTEPADGGKRNGAPCGQYEPKVLRHQALLMVLLMLLSRVRIVP